MGLLQGEWIIIINLIIFTLLLLVAIYQLFRSVKYALYKNNL